MPGIGIGAGLKHLRRVPSAGGLAAPVNTVLPKFVDGLGNAVAAPVAGQQLFIDVGTWTNAPTAFVWKVYDDAGAILGASDTAAASSEDFYIVYDSEIGRALHIGVIAGNGMNSAETMSANTAAVVDRSIAKPTLTRTSASGVTPMTFTIGPGAGVFVGDELRIQVCSDSTFDPSLILQDIFYVLTEADLQTPFTPDLSASVPTAFSNPTALQYMRVLVEGRTPQGRVITSVVSDPISPTDAVAPVAFNPADKASATLSNGNLTAALNGNVAYARSTRGVSGKSYAEFHVDVLGGTLAVGVSDPTEGGLTTNWAGDLDSLGVVANSDTSTHYSGTDHSGFAYGLNDVIGVHVDKPNGKVYFKKNNVNQLGGDPAAGTGGLPISPTAALLWIVQGYGGAPTVTARLAAADWSYSPEAGYGATP